MDRLARSWEGLPMIGWFDRRAAYHALVEADAKALIDQFGEQAYSEARKRQHDAPDIVDVNRPEQARSRAAMAVQGLRIGRQFLRGRRKTVV